MWKWLSDFRTLHRSSKSWNRELGGWWPIRHGPCRCGRLDRRDLLPGGSGLDRCLHEEKDYRVSIDQKWKHKLKNICFSGLWAWSNHSKAGHHILGTSLVFVWTVISEHGRALNCFLSVDLFLNTLNFFKKKQDEQQSIHSINHENKQSKIKLRLNIILLLHFAFQVLTERIMWLSWNIFM